MSFRSKRATNAAININSGNEIYIVNNNIGSFNTSPAVLLGSANQVSQVSNNNIFGSTLVSVGGSVYTTLSALQGAGYGAGSVSVNPGFNGTDLHTCVAELNGAALPFPFIIADVDGDARSTTPDIGADEFVGDANNLLLQDHFLKCPNEQVTIGNAPVSGVTYSWTPSGNASQVSTTTAGTYIVTATSSCGSYRDTAVVENKPVPVASFTSTNVGLAGIFTNTSTNATGYSWDFGDSHTSTDMSPTHVYSTGGTYTVTLTVTNECGSHSVTQPITVVSSGISENKLTNMTLFPNPTEGNTTLQFDGLNANAVMTVFDITGKVVLTKNVTAGVNQVTFDASGFAPGVYSVKLDSGKNVSVLRFVKQ